MGTYSNDDEGFVSKNKSLANKACLVACTAKHYKREAEAIKLDIELIKTYVPDMCLEDAKRALATIRELEAGNRRFDVEPGWAPRGVEEI